jgi:hypothetical protein
MYMSSALAFSATSCTPLADISPISYACDGIEAAV